MATHKAAQAVIQQIDAGACGRLIAAATKQCSEPTARVAEVHTTSTADAIAGLAVALSYATFGLAILALVAGIGWLIYVRHRTKAEAKSEVAKVAPTEVRAYLDEHLPGLVAEAFAALAPGQSGQSGGVSADEQASDLGGEPGTSPGAK